MNYKIIVGAAATVVVGILTAIKVLSSKKDDFTEFASIYPTHVVDLTLSVLREMIRVKLSDEKNDKVAVGDLNIMLNNMRERPDDKPGGIMPVNVISKLVEEGFTHVMAVVDENGKVSWIELIKDKLKGSDQQAADYINKTGEGVVVISA